MLKLVRIDPERRGELLEAVKQFAAELKAKLPVSAVYLYGSFARGEVHEGSDIDLIVVGDFTERLPYRIMRILELTNLPIEPLVYTPAEREQMLRDGNAFLTQALKGAIAL